MSDPDEQEQYNRLAAVKFNPSSGFEFTDLDGMFRAAQCYLQSGLAPTSFKTAQQLIICWAYGAELGLPPFQAIAGISVINNRIGIMGDLALAMVRKTGELADYQKKWSGEGDDLTCTVTLQRKGHKPHEYSFSVREAKEAGIYDRNPTWPRYKKRMTYYRALGFGLRDDFSDILKGMYTTEELEDLAHQEAQERDKADVKIVEIDQMKGAEGQSMIAAPAGEPIPLPPQTGGGLATQLARDYPEEAAKAEKKFAPTSQPSTPTQPLPPSPTPSPPSPPSSVPSSPQGPPDDIDYGPSMDTVAPAPPWWFEHQIKGVRSFVGRTVGSLSVTELGLIETKWVPAAHAQLAKCSDDQLRDLKAFEERIEHDKVAKPWGSG